MRTIDHTERLELYYPEASETSETSSYTPPSPLGHDPLTHICLILENVYPYVVLMQIGTRAATIAIMTSPSGDQMALVKDNRK